MMTSAFHLDPAPSRVVVRRGPDHYDDRAAVTRLVQDALDALNLPPGFLQPGQHVVLKPNWIKEHDERRPGPDQWAHLITHPAVIDAVARWAAARLQGQGRLTLCDAPQTDSSFDRIRAYCELDEWRAVLQSDFPQLQIELQDLRPEEWRAVDGVTVAKRNLPGDPAGHTCVALNEASHFVGFHGDGRLYGASFDMAETNRRHHGTHHEYLLCRTPMDADVLINLPKLKTHKKVGVTCALKNLVGINANKNWLPHHTEGTPPEGGDQFADAQARARLEQRWMGAAKRFIARHPAAAYGLVPFKKIGRLFFGDTQQTIRSGNWHGNDTCWRMVLDLNKCLFYFDGTGHPRQRALSYLTVVDGIIGGEGNGPMAPDPKPCGVVLAGVHPVAVDWAAATLMGFDPQRLRLLTQALASDQLPLAPFTADEIELDADHPSWHGPLANCHDTFAFKPHFGWVGAIEKRSTREH